MSESCLISEVIYNNTDLNPVIINFENGKLNNGCEDRLSCQIFRDKTNKLHAAVATENLVYSGSIDCDQLHNNFIAVRNKNTKKIRLIAVDYAMLAPVFEQEENLLDHSSEIKDISVMELNKQFGSKRIKRQTEQRERMKLDVENVREQLEQTVADVRVDVEQMLPSIDENDNDYKPHIDRSATKVEQVYLLNSIVSSKVLESLTEEVQRIFEAEKEEDMGTSKFITQEIKRLKTSSEEKERYQLFLYIDCLIKFMVVPAKVVSSKKYVACSYSEFANKHILNSFTISSPKGRLRPNIMRDKCLCYILVLSTIACKYKLNLEIISKELKIGIKKLQDVCKVLALSVSNEIATLKLPLPAPISGNKRNRKKN